MRIIGNSTQKCKNKTSLRHLHSFQFSFFSFCEVIIIDKTATMKIAMSSSAMPYRLQFILPRSWNLVADPIRQKCAEVGDLVAEQDTKRTKECGVIFRNIVPKWLESGHEVTARADA
jgi:hypothetical protein